MILYLAGCAILFVLFRWLKRSIKSSLPLPPGPKGYPLIGNMLDMPAVAPWKTYQEWHGVYGGIIYLDLPRKPTIIIGSVKVALDLLEKRSGVYSDRQVNVMDELMTWDFNLGLMPYSQKWRNHRRMFHQYFNQNEIHKYQAVQIRECRAFLQQALDSPENLAQHVRQLNTAIILKIVYDMDITDMNYDYVGVAQEAVRGLSLGGIPGAHWVEYMPILKYIPSWVPGARFKKLADYFRPFVEAMRNRPFDQIKQDIVDGNASPSIARTLIKRLQDQFAGTHLEAEQEEIARNVTGVAYAAAADTTTSAAQSFLIAMSLYPDVQRKAQVELDHVVGSERLPDFSDHDDLVYIQAIALESMRWTVALPLGVPHKVTQDDEYNGFFIPKNTTVIANAWAMLHDPDDYPEPERFVPERFMKDGRLDPNVRSPLSIAFGFGRRICPGRHLSGASLFLTIASVLHTLNIRPILEEDGKPVDTSAMMSTGLVSSPESIPYIISPRSTKAECLIRE
ncbi:unnamed protein product [Somion occarium]|uniref:Cytochrome P450 n=1 Tax=Somion occarium TaxID=3059160 RepID=A0ABP1CZY1_9APHY